MTQSNSRPQSRTQSLKHITKLICFGIVIFSVLSCVVVAMIRSRGLTSVTVTALDANAEPRDHNIPFIKQKDALPDYVVILQLSSGRRVHLGTKPNTSAVDGLTWELSDPVSISEVASVRLQDRDKVVSDAITEVQITSNSVSADNYRFDFTIERSLTVGIESFFNTPIGKGIVAAFLIAILLILVGVFVA